MDKLTQGKFFYLLNSNNPKEATPETLALAYLEFTEELFNTILSEHDFSFRYHRISCAIAEVTALLERKKKESKVFPDMVVEYLLKAESLLKTHFHLLTLEAQFPDRLNKQKTKKSKQYHAFKWVNSKRDLVSVLSAWDDIKSIVNPETGEPISFKMLADFFGDLFGLDMSRAYQIREELSSRKSKPTSFIDKMRQTLLNRSEK